MPSTLSEEDIGQSKLKSGRREVGCTRSTVSSILEGGAVLLKQLLSPVLSRRNSSSVMLQSATLHSTCFFYSIPQGSRKLRSYTVSMGGKPVVFVHPIRADWSSAFSFLCHLFLVGWYILAQILLLSPSSLFSPLPANLISSADYRPFTT